MKQKHRQNVQIVELDLECLGSVGSIIAVSLGFELPSLPKMNEERSSFPEQRPVIEPWSL